jgi:hypothetical protein
MFNKIKEWIKIHKMFTFNIIAVVIIFLFLFSGNIRRVGYNMSGTKSSYTGSMYDASYAPTPLSYSGIQENAKYPSDISYESMPNEANISNRKVVTNTNFSLHVKNVDDTVEKIRNKTTEMGGFMVNTDIRRDEAASSSDLQVRVPSDKLVEFSKYLKTLAVKVVYENISGNDITDQYVDYEEKLRSLESVKERFEEIMEEAETVDEIMDVQNRIFSIQSQIDSIKGQLTYMDRSTATSKVTISISTDELSLPYTPVKSWRPDVVIKNAVRSLISTFRAVATIAIWVLVFLPLILFAVAVKISIKYLSRNRKRKENIKDLK